MKLFIKIAIICIVIYTLIVITIRYKYIQIRNNVNYDIKIGQAGQWVLKQNIRFDKIHDSLLDFAAIAYYPIAIIFHANSKYLPSSAEISTIDLIKNEINKMKPGIVKININYLEGDLIGPYTANVFGTSDEVFNYQAWFNSGTCDLIPLE